MSVRSGNGGRWLAQGRRDLDDAEFARSGGRHNLACFLAQQAAEKVLKAFLYARGAEEVWGHSVAELCRDAASLDSALAAVQTQAASLDKYYIPTRYPDALPGGIPADAFSEQDAEMAIGLARAVISAVEALIGKP